jgi:hypothetical protein
MGINPRCLILVHKPVTNFRPFNVLPDIFHAGFGAQDFCPQQAMTVTKPQNSLYIVKLSEAE